MSYEAAVAWSIVRSLLAGALCWGLARVLRGSLQQSAVSSQPAKAHRLQPVGLPPNAQPSPGGPRLRFGLLYLVPFFMPGLVVGYAYRNASLSLVQTPLLNELLYLAIVVAQLTPVVVLALEWLPAAALGPSGAFLWKQAQRSGRKVPLGNRLRAILAGELPRQLTAAALAALLCFQEVEVATLMQARGWAEWIFTKQAGGVELTEVLPFLVLPVGYGLLLTVPVLWYWMWRDEHRPGEPVGVSPRTESRDGSGGLRPPARLLAWVVVASSWLLVIIWPVASLALGAFRGAGVIHFRSALWQEIGDALVLGVTVTVLLCLILWGSQRLGGRVPGGRGSRRAANAGGHSHRFSAFCPLSPTIGASDSEDSTVGERVGVRGPCSLVDPLTLALSPAVESSEKATSTAGERGPESNEMRSGFSFVARQEPRPPEPRPPVWWYVGRLVWVAALLPGLLGSLALGLAIFEICQRIGVEPSYSPVPLVVAMVLFLLPRALAMQAMLRRNEHHAGVFLAERLAQLPGPRGRQGAAILWRIRDAGRFWTLAVLFWWSYLELTLPALLRPAGMAPAPLRLYNFLHYNQIPGLAAMLAVVLVVPGVLLVGVFLWLRGGWPNRE